MTMLSENTINCLLMWIGSGRLSRSTSTITHIRSSTNNIKNYLLRSPLLKKVFVHFISDKVTLLNNMHELDQKRTKTLEACFKLVKENLGTIFNDLLPGATAHLTLVD